MHQTKATEQDRALAHYGAMAAQATAAHTPGPWVWEGTALRPADPRPDTHHVHTILDAGYGGSGFLASDWRSTLREIDADMRLIAAAPLLLEALQSCVDRLEVLAPPNVKFTVAKARAAIAAATQEGV